jgi:YidC/Oxa1 family membrane protein insertase
MSTTMDKTQRTLLLLLPLAFLFVVINFPAGLVLYWMTTNLWTVGQGLVTRRLVPKTPAPQKRSSRTPPRGEQEPAEPATEKAAHGDGKAGAPAAPQQVRKVKKKKKRARR